MKSYYLMIHNGPEGQRVFVEGFFVPRAVDKEDARNQIIAILKEALLKSKNFHTNNYIEQLYSLEHPDEVNYRGDKLLVIKEYSKPVCCGFWLTPPGDSNHLCNLLR